MKHHFSLLLPLAILILLSACTPSASPVAPAAADTLFPISIGETQIQLELALSQGEQSKGLMHRDTMPAEQGMLFLFPKVKKASFWMRNTRIPLDIGYFDASGRLMEIHSLYPYDETPVASRSEQVLIAIETNRGWFQQNGIEPNAQLDLEALKTAIIRRGKSLDNSQLQTAQ